MMMKKDVNQYVEKLNRLIEEGEKIENLVQPTKNPNIHTIQQGDTLQSWLTRSQNAVFLTFGESSFQYKKIQELMAKKTYYPSVVREIYGLLSGCKIDLEEGFIFGLEFLFLRDTFSSLLEDAEELNSKGYSRSAAIYCRVIVENTLKKLASKSGINIEKKTASGLNDALKGMAFFDEATHEDVKAWLLIGNKAAHEESFEHKQDEIEKMVKDIEDFVETQLGETDDGR